jgi:hypothetical protein
MGWEAMTEQATAGRLMHDRVRPFPEKQQRAIEMLLQDQGLLREDGGRARGHGWDGRILGVAMRPQTDPPAGLIPVPLGKGCLLLLTEPEFVAGIRRGKSWRRRLALASRPDPSLPRPS